MKKAISLGLALLMLLPLFAGCSESAVNENDNKGTGTEVELAEGLTEEEEEVTRANIKDSLPEGLNFDGMTLNISYFGNESVRNYDAVGELTGDIVLDEVYNRNITVEDRLNLKFNWLEGSGDWGGYPGEVEVILRAGTGDYDFIMEESSQLFKQSIQGYFLDFNNLNYIDFNQPWWYTDLMEESQLNNKVRYFITGDICPTVLMYASAMYFNKPMFTDYFQDVNKIYDAVIEGTWTYDVFADYCRNVYTDTNGNGKADNDDIMGFRFEQWGFPNHASMSTGLKYNTRDEEGYPILDIYNENGIRWGETLYKILYTDNISMEGPKGDTFIKQTSLFYPGQLATATGLRDVDFEYGIIPYPKLDESLDYLCGAGTANGCSVSIPKSTAADRVDAACAAIEALSAESYRRVIPALFETAMKVKYSDATIDSRMIDIIYEHVNSPFIMMADKLLGIGSIYTSAVYGSNNEGAFASYYAKQEKPINKKLQKAIDDYKALENEG